jgi:hypothetical protein
MSNLGHCMSYAMILCLQRYLQPINSISMIEAILLYTSLRSPPQCIVTLRPTCRPFRNSIRTRLADDQPLQAALQSSHLLHLPFSDILGSLFSFLLCISARQSSAHHSDRIIAALLYWRSYSRQRCEQIAIRHEPCHWRCVSVVQTGLRLI